MASAGDRRAQVEREGERRRRLAVPAFAGGVIYLLSAIVIQATVGGAPTVGPLQGLAPALRGEVNPGVSPRAAEVKFISHRAFALIAGSVLAALAITVLVLTLLLLLDAARSRRPQTSAAARPLALAGGAALAVVSVANQIARAIETHKFAVGHDFSNRAVDHALTKAASYIAFDYLDLLAGLALAAGMIVVVLNSMRVGLLPRWMGLLGMLTAVLIFLPLGGATLEIVPAFWLVMMGILFAGRWPNGEPPAWAAGEARPWPTPAEQRAAREQGKAGSSGNGREKPAGAPAGDASPADDVAPEPSRPAQAAGARKRRRKRGARR